MAKVLSSRAWEPNCEFTAWSVAIGLAPNADGPMNGPKPNGMPPAHPGIGGQAGPNGGIHPGAVPAEVPNEGVATAFAAADAAVPALRVVRSCEYVLNMVGPQPRPGPAVMDSCGKLNENAAVAVHARTGNVKATRIRTYALLSLIIQHPLNNISY